MTEAPPSPLVSEFHESPTKGVSRKWGTGIHETPIRRPVGWEFLVSGLSAQARAAYRAFRCTSRGHFDAHVASDGSDKPLPGAIRAGASHLGRNGYFFIIQAPGMPTTHSSSPKGGGDSGGADPDDLLGRVKTRLRRAPG